MFLILILCIFIILLFQWNGVIFLAVSFVAIVLPPFIKGLFTKPGPELSEDEPFDPTTL